MLILYIGYISVEIIIASLLIVFSWMLLKELPDHFLEDNLMDMVSKKVNIWTRIMYLVFCNILSKLITQW